VDSSVDDTPIGSMIEPSAPMPASITEPPLRNFSCYCGTRLTIAMIPGTTKECLCGALHEVTAMGVRTV
jgi:hypothetical protein